MHQLVPIFLRSIRSLEFSFTWNLHVKCEILRQNKTNNWQMTEEYGGLRRNHYSGF